jgi:hypothetical protein
MQISLQASTADDDLVESQAYTGIFALEDTCALIRQQSVIVFQRVPVLRNGKTTTAAVTHPESGYLTWLPQTAANFSVKVCCTSMDTGIKPKINNYVPT